MGILGRFRRVRKKFRGNKGGFDKREKRGEMKRSARDTRGEQGLFEQKLSFSKAHGHQYSKGEIVKGRETRKASRMMCFQGKCIP